MRIRCALVVFVATLFCSGNGGGVVVSSKTVDGKQVMCMHTGLMSSLNDCGTRSNWYSYVFVGSVSKVTPRITPHQGSEFELRIVPEEIFSGKPDNPITVITSQGLCLPKLVVGDRWLFYLRKEAGKPIVLDFYGNDSLPVADAKEQIETLRHLEKVGDRVLLRGQVLRGMFFDGKPVPSARVTARRESDGMQFVSTTDAEGHYEFPPLSPGDYKITVPPIESYQPEEIDLKPRTCWDLQLSPSPKTKSAVR